MSKEPALAARGAGGLRPVLVISYYFPPAGGPGVQRVLKFARYLPENGWRPIVLTVPRTAAYPVLDPSLCDEVPPEAVVVRSRILEFYGLWRLAAGAPAPRLATSAEGDSGRARVLRRIRAALFIPDGRMGWFPFGVEAGRRAIAEHHPHVILASGPPFTAHWIGARLSARTGLPLVLDFRDPWIGAPFYPVRPAWSRRRDEALEHACIRQASAVVTVNEDIRDDLQRRHTAGDRVWNVLPNGFDPADFAAPAAAGDASSPDEWTLTYTGTVPTRLPAGFLPGLRAFLERRPEALGRMRVRFVGTVAEARARELSAPPLDRVVRIEGYRPHHEAVRALLEIHLVLLFVESGPRARGMVTGKLFEYVGSGTPVLALAPEDGEAAAILRHTGAGRVVDGESPLAITTALEAGWHAFNQGNRPFGAPRAEAVAAYSRPHLTRRLAAILETAAPLVPPARRP